MHMPRLVWRGKRDWVLLCILMILFVYLAVMFGAMYQDNRSTHDFYGKAVIGESGVDYASVADGVVCFGRYRIYYVFGHWIASGKPVKLPESINSFKELPSIYDAMQYMVDENGTLISKSHCGEGASLSPPSEYVVK